MSKQQKPSSASSPPPESVKRTQIIYPVYIDKNKSLSEGRRIPKDKCVENPKASEIVDICEYLKIPYEFEVGFCIMSVYIWVDGLVNMLLSD